MRKFLRLSLVCLMAMVCGTVFAQTTEEFDFKGNEGYGLPLISENSEYNTDPAECSKGNVTIVLNGKTRWWKGTKNNDLRFYEGSSFTVNVPDNYVITNVAITGSHAFSTADGACSNGKWSGNANTVNFTYTSKSSGKVTIIEVTYEDAPDDYVTAPTITGTTPFDGTTEVTITGGDGTTIYYTIDGTEPTTATTTKGASPVKFNINKTTTVKAIAVKGSNQSTVVTKEFTKAEFTDMTIADLYKLDAPQENINLTINNGKVVYVDGDDVYVRDGEYAILFFRTSLPFSKNATVSGTVKADYDIYNGLPEIADNAFTNASALNIEESDEEALPLNATIKDIVTDGKYMCDLVKIENVTITATNTGTEDKPKYNYYATDGTDQILLYGADEVVKDYADDETEYNLTAVVKKFKTAQLLPISVETATGITDVTIEKEFDENAPIYNLSGQRVDKNAKGILIQNGKKFIRR